VVIVRKTTTPPMTEWQNVVSQKWRVVSTAVTPRFFRR
jgi:hypothetical protein